MQGLRWHYYDVAQGTWEHLSKRDRVFFWGLFGEIKRQFEGLTMVDSEACRADVASTKMPFLGDVGDTMVCGVSECLCRMCYKSKQSSFHRKPSRYSRYNVLDPEKTRFLTAQSILPPSKPTSSHLELGVRATGKSYAHVPGVPEIYIFKNCIRGTRPRGRSGPRNSV